MDRIEIRKTMAVVTLKLIVLQVLFSLFFLVTSLVSDSISEFNNTLYMDVIAYDSLIYVLLTITQLVFTSYILLQWSLDKYIIFSDKIDHISGIIFKKTESYDTKNVESAHINEGIMGRIFKYGSITLHSPTLENHIILNNISSPALLLQTIKANLASLDKSKLVFMKGES